MFRLQLFNLTVLVGLVHHLVLLPQLPQLPLPQLFSQRFAEPAFAVSGVLGQDLLVQVALATVNLLLSFLQFQ